MATNKNKVNNIENIEQAKTLLELSKKQQLSKEQIEVLKTLHVGYGALGFDNTQYFTPDSVINYMIKSLKISGFEGDCEILEPSFGNGKIIDVLSKNFKNINITGIELNKTLYEIAKVCYPYANLINEDALLLLDTLENKFDLVIGNPPFGKDIKRNEYQFGKNSLEGNFVELALKALKPGGHLIMIIPDNICSANKYLDLRKQILNDFVLIQSVSLPSNTFYFSGTSISTNIIHCRKKMKNSDYNYSIFMNVVDSIGWDNRGRKSKNELTESLEEFKNFYHNQCLNQNKIFFK